MIQNRERLIKKLKRNRKDKFKQKIADWKKRQQKFILALCKSATEKLIQRMNKQNA